ncbi:MAG: hypothetical protein WC284_16900 [Candidimonas sp.]
MLVFEVITHPSMLYHFTSGDSLRKIINEDMLEDRTTHEIDGEIFDGVSLTRDHNLNLLATYAVSGHKPFRLGLDRDKLKQKYKIIPIRDKNYQKFHKAKTHKSNYLSNIMMHDVIVPVNESEEFVVGSINPLTRYWKELVVDPNFIDIIINHNDGEDYDENEQTLMDIMYGTFRMYKEHAKRPIRLPNTVDFYETDLQGYPGHKSERKIIPRR